MRRRSTERHVAVKIASSSSISASDAVGSAARNPTWEHGVQGTASAAAGVAWCAHNGTRCRMRLTTTQPIKAQHKPALCGRAGNAGVRLQTSKSLLRSSNCTSSSRPVICITSSPDLLPPLTAPSLAQLAGRSEIAERCAARFPERKSGADPWRTTPPNGARKPAAGAARARATTHAARMLAGRVISVRTQALPYRRERTGATPGERGIGWTGIGPLFC